MKIIYIAGASHSGSTLLSLMLNAHPEVIAAGELEELVRTALSQRRRRPNAPHRCTCHAASIWDCPLWSGVNDYLRADSSLSLADLNVDNYADPESFYADNALLFEAISSVSGKKFIVDSSKGYKRLSLLMKTPSLDIFPVLLQRDTRGQIWSSMKKGRTSLGRLILENVIITFSIYEAVKEHPYLRLAYEDLVRRPESTLRALMQQVGLDYHPNQLQWANQERHNIAGNRMRWKGQSELREDLSWRSNLTFLQAIIVRGATAPVRVSVVRSALRPLSRLIRRFGQTKILAHN